MTATGYFSNDYVSARQRLFAAAETAGASLNSVHHPGNGPEREMLSTEIAWFGPENAERVLVTISGTHGVEGFCGSGCQVGLFESGLLRDWPSNLALLQIHAINPHGFAWLRRVTEDNVDLNRNFIDFAKPLPVNKGYQLLHSLICPREWNDASIAASQRALDTFIEEHGEKAMRSAVSGGQYHYDDGIFFGGRTPTWSHLRLKEILRAKLGHARKVAVIDFHTGLGPRGHGERICPHLPDSAGLATARQWYDGDITSPALGTSSAVELHGHNVVGIEEALPAAEVIAVALEFGTLPSPEVRLALRADNWLHNYGELGSSKARSIKGQIREAFYQDDDDWKAMVWERAAETVNLARRGLNES